MSEAGSRPPRHGLRRLVTGMHAGTAALLAVVLFVMVNHIASRFPGRWDVSRAQPYTLTDKTRSILANIHTDIEIDVVYSPHHESFNRVRALLEEYAYEARHVPSTLALRIRYIDPDRDLAAMKELRQRAGLAERSVLLVRNGARAHIVTDAELYELVPGTREIAAFSGEAAVSSALMKVVQQEEPIVYYVLGHGERDFESHEQSAGYSRIGHVIQRDNVVLRPLVLAHAQGVPEDCDALLIAGPTRRFAASEVELIASYLERRGRVLALLDPFVHTGLETLLARWGVRLGNDYVVDTMSFNRGRDFFVASFTRHPITRQLRNIAVAMSMPRSVEATAPLAADSSDRPRVTVLARTSPESWAELNLDATRVHFDEGVDRGGPIGLAAAVERGVHSVRVALAPARLVVIGDSDLVANAALENSLGGNVDFFMASLNWLLDREELMALAPRPLDGFHLRLDRDRMRWLTLTLTAGLPGCAALLGLLIWRLRRR